MVMPYPSASVTIRFFVPPSIFSVIVERSFVVGFAGRPFMPDTLLKAGCIQGNYLLYYCLTNDYYTKGVKL